MHCRYLRRKKNHQHSDLGARGERRMNCKRSKSATWGRSLLLMCAFIFSVSVISAQTHRMSRDLEARVDSGNVDVIVQFNHEPADSDHQRVLSHGGQLKRQLGHFRGAVYSVTAARLAELASDPNVAYVSPDRPITGAGANSPAWVLDYHNESINAPAAWAQGLDGSGIGVAVIDSGIANVADLRGNYQKFGFSNVVYSQDFTGDSVGSTADQYGHGTHV